MAEKSGQPEMLAEALRRDPRIYFAAERTYLAWIRTGLALMGFGFVVARFGLFLKEMAASRPDLGVKSSGFSLVVGTGLILIGVLVNITSRVKHYQVIEQLNRNEAAVGEHSVVAIIVSSALAALGVGMAVYLLAVH